LIEKAGALARQAVIDADVEMLADAIALSHEAQCGEGMTALPIVESCLARKYCGGGHGGYGTLKSFPNNCVESSISCHRSVFVCNKT
jgi:hypothetical protein